MKKLTQEEYEQRVFKAHRDNIKILGQYKNRRTKILAECKCGYQWDVAPESLTRGHGCPRCADNLKRTTEEFALDVEKLGNGGYTLIGEYKGKDTPIRMKHLKCGKEFDMAPKAFLAGQRCPHSRYERSAKANMVPFDEAREQVHEVSDGEYTLIGGYSGMSKKALITHNSCGNTYKQEPTRIVNDNIGCPICRESKGEQAVRGWLESKRIKFEEQVRIEGCKNKRELPFDFGVYGANEELLFLIEYDGSQHYYPKFGEEQFRQTKNNDSIKTNFCIKNNIPLIRVKFIREGNPVKFKERVWQELEESIINQGNTEPSLTEIVRKV